MLFIGYNGLISLRRWGWGVGPGILNDFAWGNEFGEKGAPFRILRGVLYLYGIFNVPAGGDFKTGCRIVVVGGGNKILVIILVSTDG